MSEHGFIHDSLDIKILILYVICRLPAGAELSALSQLVMIDAGFDYFDFADSLSSLEETGHISCENGVYTATAKGIKNSALVEESLPYSVRNAASSALAPLAAAQAHDAMIKTSRHTGKTGDILELSLSDGIGEMLNVRLIVPTDDDADKFERRFRADPEGFYGKLIGLLSGE